MRCSVTVTDTAGTSVTWWRAIATTIAVSKPDPHRRQAAGTCSITTSGSSVRPSENPCVPGCFPGLRPVARRKDRGGGACSGPSAEGGFEEFREFWPNRRFNSVFSARRAVFSASSSATRASSSSRRASNRSSDTPS